MSKGHGSRINTASSDIDLDEGIIAAFERTVQAYPASIALCSSSWEPTYQELNAVVNRLAHQLSKIGAVGDRVAILMEHDAPAIAAYLAGVKAGRIIVALFAGDPASRLKLLIADSGPSVLVTDATNRELAREIRDTGCTVLDFESAIAAGPVDNPPLANGEIVALVYTSGATGRPKGVMYTQRQFRRNAAVHTKAMGYTSADRIPMLSAMNTGQGANCPWYSLIAGATLCPFPIKQRGVSGLAEWILDSRLTIYGSSASVFRTLIKTLDRQTVFPEIRAVRLASEAATADDYRSFQRHFPSAGIFVHTLASSETGNIAWSAWPRTADLADGVLPVGHISTDMEVSLVRDDDRPVDPGEIGEIVVRSRYVSAGYWGDPTLTAERFSDALDGSGCRIIRTGDLARFDLASRLEFCGRKDDRIKIRGNRIELADVERALARLHGIDQATAVALPRENQEPMLVSFIVLASDATWSETRLRHAVSANLPLHMVPSRFVFVEALPFNPGGKIDREVLRKYPLPKREDPIGEAPQTEIETLLADIWAEVLEVPQIARDDDFFSLGGDSLKGAIVAAQINAAFGIEVNLAEVAHHPTVSTLAALVDGRRHAGDAASSPVVPVSRDRPHPLTSYQERLWRILQTRPLEQPARMFLIVGKLDVNVLKDCLSYLVDRHESLRTTFRIVDGQPAQIVHPSGPLHFLSIDVSSEHDPEERAQTFAAEEANKTIDPGILPTTRHLLFKTRHNEHLLARIAHPLAQDAWSFTILLTELTALYEAKLKGVEPPIPKEMPLQYVDYGAWHSELMRADGPVFRETLDWWKEVFAKRLTPIRLPFRRSRSRRLTGVDHKLGVIEWKIDDNTAQRLDQTARGAGATHFVVRLACCVALLGDVTGRANVVLGTFFANRRRMAARNIVGQLSTLAPLVLRYDPKSPLRTWITTVRDRLYETEMHAEIPYEELYEQLRIAGLKPPGVRITFFMGSDLPEQSFGDLTLKRIAYPIGTMPWGCQFYIDERNPENCRVDFDANLYDRGGMEAMVDRYLRLIEIASQQPELTIGRLVALSSDNRLRRAIANYASRSRERIAAG